MGTDIFTDPTLRWAAKDGTCLACGTYRRNWEAHGGGVLALGEWATAEALASCPSAEATP